MTEQETDKMCWCGGFAVV